MYLYVLIYILILYLYYEHYYTYTYICVCNFLVTNSWKWNFLICVPSRQTSFFSDYKAVETKNIFEI